eukprot:4862705-Amphidinium_carterae.1
MCIRDSTLATGNQQRYPNGFVNVENGRNTLTNVIPDSLQLRRRNRSNLEQRAMVLQQVLNLSATVLRSSKSSEALH